MIGLIFLIALPILSIIALRNQEVRWAFTIPLALIPAGFVFFLGLIGIIIGVAVVVSYWKIDLPA